MPLIVVIDELAGYSVIPCNEGASAWGIFTANSQAAEEQRRKKASPSAGEQPRGRGTDNEKKNFLKYG